MQVNATLIAAQQAAREAQAKFHAARVAPTIAAGPEKSQGFSPLPLKQTAPAPQPEQAVPNPAARLGTMVDIKI